MFLLKFSFAVVEIDIMFPHVFGCSKDLIFRQWKTFVSKNDFCHTLLGCHWMPGFHHRLQDDQKSFYVTA